MSLLINQQDDRPNRVAVANALLNVGQICGVASKINVSVLSEFLQNPPSDFLYTKQCQAVVNLLIELEESFKE